MATNKGHKNIIGKGFDKRPQNINKKGRPKVTVHGLLDELKSEGYKELTSADIKSLYLSLLDRTQDQLTDLVSNTGSSMFIRIVAKAMLDKKGFDIIERMLDRSVGKATQLLGEDPNNKFQTLADALLQARANMIKAKQKNELP